MIAGCADAMNTYIFPLHIFLYRLVPHINPYFPTFVRADFSSKLQLITKLTAHILRNLAGGDDR